jgi:hypothetical protein
MTYKIPNKKVIMIDRGLSKKGDMRSLNFVEVDGMRFWTLIPPQKDEKLLKNKVFSIKSLKEGWNKGEYFSEGVGA